MNRTALFLSIAFAASAAALVACSGDDTAIPAPSPDASIDSSTSHPDASGAHDTSTGNDANGGSDSNTGNDSNSAVDTGTVTDASTADANDGAAAVDAACNGVELTVIDDLDWCTITITGGPPAFSSGSRTVCVAPDSTTTLSATANPGFVLGPWHNTANAGSDLDAGGANVTTITVGDGGASCAWICCPGNAANAGLTCPSTLAACP